MATIVLQLGLATIPLGIELRTSPLTSGTTRGTSGSMRQADELSMTMTPAAATLGARARDAVAPLENSATAIPAKSAVAASSTGMSTPWKDRSRPADREEAKNRTSSRATLRSWRIDRMTDPTWPVAPTTATRIPPSYETGPCALARRRLAPRPGAVWPEPIRAPMGEARWVRLDG